MPLFYCMLTEDLSVFFNADEHGVECVILDTQDIITGIFDKPYSDALDIQGFSPSLTCASVDVADKALSRGARIDIPGEAVYRVATFEPDGTGVTRIILETDA